MDPSQVAVATISWARTPDEELAMREALPLLTAAGLPVAVADRGGNAEFSRFLDQLDGARTLVAHERGLVPQVIASLELAASFDRPWILYTEPDKAEFFRSHLGDFLQRAHSASDVGVNLAARFADSLQTFPPMQRYTEGVINRLVGDLIGKEGDYSYGPFLMRRELLPTLVAADAALGWGWRHFMFLSAHRAGLRVCHVRGDYLCPTAHRQEYESDRLYRIKQLSENLQGLLYAAPETVGRAVTVPKEQNDGTAQRRRMAS